MRRTTMGTALTVILLLAVGTTVQVACASGVDCNDNGIDDNCDIDCGASGGVCDVPGCGMSEDCNGHGVPDECEELGWQQAAKFLPNDGAPEDRFGVSVSVSDDVAVIGAHQDDDNGTDSGSGFFLDFANPDCNGNAIPDECHRRRDFARRQWKRYSRRM